MSKRTSASAVSSPTFNAFEVGKLTWIGLLTAVLGWALLLGGATIADGLIAKSPRPLPATLHNDLVEIAKCVIVSGFGVAIIGALQSGFGTLNRFFGAVLMRSAQRDAEPVRPVEPSVERPMQGKRRPYRQFSDGSVEVDTIVGTRTFKTMTEARDFI